MLLSKFHLFLGGKKTFMYRYLCPATHGYGSVTASAYPVKEVSGSRPGRVILKTLKLVPTAALFGVGHIRVGSVITISR